MTTMSLPILDRAPFRDRFPHELTRTGISTLQINIGRLCNLACNHCHVESSPSRTAPGDNMTASTARRIVEWVRAHESIRTVDFTGGSPEMNPNYRPMVEAVRAAGRHVMTRCNPTIIGYVDAGGETPYESIPRFFAENRVEVVASLPCYLASNVERQRGRRSYRDSIDGLLALNAVGYGHDPDLPLNLVYNPVGPTLPPQQR